VRRIAALGCTAAVVLATPATGAQRDFGDAPDGAPAYQAVAGHFPTLKSSRGPRHGQVGALRLGRGETREANSRQVDLDLQDDGFSSALTACTVSNVWFVVNASKLPARLRRGRHVAYLNAWFDFNQDGRWNGASGCAGGKAPEWGVHNVAIPLSAFAKRPIQVVRVAVAAGPRVIDIWQRATLTLDQKVRREGARGGRFRFGETEDFGPHAANATGGQTPGGRPVLTTDDDPDIFCREWDLQKGQLGPPGMPAFIDHGGSAIFDVEIVSKNGDPDAPFGDVLLTVGKPVVLFGDPPDGIVSGFPFGGGPAPWNSVFGVFARSTAVDERKNPVQFVVIPVSGGGPQVGFLSVDCPLIVAHEVLIPKGANTFQPQPTVTTTIDTTVGPPTITGGGQTGGDSGGGSTVIVG
jgi:hypothetical protein